MTIALSFFLLACSTPLYYYRSDTEKLSGVRKVAVLPFRNISSRREAGKIITNLFIEELFNSGLYQIEDMGNISEFFIRQRIRKKGELDLDTIKMLGVQFHLDAVILGVVEEYYQMEGGRREVCPQVGLSARMIDVKDGRILWKSHHRASGDDHIIVFNWGRVRTATLLARKVIREMIVALETL